MSLLERNWKDYYLTEDFEKQFDYDGKLGVECGRDGTTFRLWAPTAVSVKLRFFKNGSAEEDIAGSLSEPVAAARAGMSKEELDQSSLKAPDTPINIYPMQKQPYGLWTLHSEKNLSGIYYDYQITLPQTVEALEKKSDVKDIDKTDEDKTDDDKSEYYVVNTVDPYAKACGVNGRRGMIIDLSKTDPEGWDKDKAPQKPSESVIYETHVKEFSYDRSGGFPAKYRGRFLAFTAKDPYLYKADALMADDEREEERDTIQNSIPGNPDCPTGLDFVQKLGVTYIELLPIYDYASVDEDTAYKTHNKGSQDGEPFNWGYDPMNYNCPEGSYSSDPYHAEVRITELKKAVMAIHQAGLRVIMDVVYNHTYNLETPFQKTVPWYYYRLDKDGNLSDGSCCGNDTASEMPMCEKFIVDSVMYWAEEYHIDGFRFDLMGLITCDTMNHVRKSLDDRFGKGEKLVFGEPWAAQQSYVENGKALADKTNMKHIDDNIGMFNDDLRDAVKGSCFNKEEAGFADGHGSVDCQEQKLVDAFFSAAGGDRSPVNSPAGTISYVSCHDNYTLWDKLSAVDFLHPLNDPEAVRIKQNKLSAAIYMIAPGRPFFLAGEEGARTKNMDGNSYNAPIEENSLDWERLYEHSSLMDYYWGLINLRKSEPVLCSKERGADNNYKVLRAAGGVVEILVQKYEEKKTASDDQSREAVDSRTEEIRKNALLLIYNCLDRKSQVELPEGQWRVLADDESSSRWKDTEPEIMSGTVYTPVTGALILKKI